MSGLKGRVDRLTQQIGGDGCPECGSGGSGPTRITFGVEGDPIPGPCTTCGAEPQIISFTVGLDKPWEDDREQVD